MTLSKMLVFWLLYHPLTAWAFIEVISTTQRYRDLNASYGPTVPPDTMTGYLVPIEYLTGDSSGCQRLNSAYRETAFWKRLEAEWNEEMHRQGHQDQPVPWIALVERGECSFGQKTMAMQASGAMAVIVGDDGPGPLIRMHADAGEVEGARIPSLFIQQWEYRELRLQASLTNQKHGRVPSLAVRLYPEDLIDWSTGEVILIGLILPLFFFLLLLFLIKAREDAQAENGLGGPFLWQDPRERPAPRPAVLALPCRPYDPMMAGPNDPDCCAICLEDFYPDAYLRRLPCKHDFHQVCIDPWLLERKRTCPICKRDSCGEESERQRREQQRARDAFFGTSWLSRYQRLTDGEAGDEDDPLLPIPTATTITTLPPLPVLPTANLPTVPHVIPINVPSLSSVRSAALTDRQAASVASLAALGVHVPMDDAEYEEARQLALTRRHL